MGITEDIKVPNGMVLH